MQQAPIGLIALAFLAAMASPAVAQVQMPRAITPAPSVAKPVPEALTSTEKTSVTTVIIRDVRVEGLQRIEPGTVFSYLPIRIGDRMSQDAVSESVRSLFSTGFFRDVRIVLEEDVLVVVVEERPAIGAIEISGAKEFDQQALKKALADTGLAEARIFDRSLLDRAEQELKRQYLGRGKYDVQIQSTITPLERNRVAISMSIDEGEDARISEIRIVGARAFKEKDLLAEFQLSTPTWMSWYTKSDQYSRQKLSADIETLRAYYLNRGFLEFSLDSSLVSLSPDRKNVFISLVIREGEQFKFGNVSLAGDLIGQDQTIAQMISIKPGETFSNERLRELSKSISDRYGELGYAFANVSPVPKVNRETRVVDFTLQVDPGRRVYVRRINISGNSKTRDEVIRREMRQFESSWFDSERIRLSRNRVDRLGYFNQVEVETSPVTGAADQVDVNFRVEERPLGSLTFGLGYSSTDRFVLSGSISQQNFMGTGTNVSLEVNTSKVNRTFAVSQFDPYWTDDGVSRSISVYQRTFDASELSDLGNYRIETLGASMRFGIPFTEEDRIFLGAGYERSNVSSSGLLPVNWAGFERNFGESADAYVLTLGWSRDSRDSGIAPTRGRLESLTLDYGTPIGELQYYRMTYGHQWFYPISKRLTYAFNAELGAGTGLGGKDYPVTKNFYLGGIGSVRGFAPSSIGPTADQENADGTINEVSTGGNRRFFVNNELLVPLPGMAQDRSIRLFSYLDFGTIWAATDEFRDQPLRASIGVGISWLSPVGPLKLSLGRAIKKEPTDETQPFQFQIGTGF